MDKLFEQVLKYLPAEIIPIALAAAAAFFGVYYYKAFRSYTDVLHDSLFLSILVILGAGFILYRFNKTEEPSLPVSAAPILLVPEFVDDERGQFKTLFIQQVGSAIQAAMKRDDAVVALNAFVLDQRTARITAERYKAIAIVWGPKIVRAGEKLFICFNLLRVDEPDLSKPYPPSPAELDKQTLSALTESLATANSAEHANLSASTSRLDMLESRIADLELAVRKLSAPESYTSLTTYKHRRAIVVGVDQHEDRSLPPLRFSISDARRMASLLRDYGFELTVLENPTSASIEQAAAQQISISSPDDFFLFYFAGSALRSDQLKIPGDPSLIFSTFDVNLQQQKSNLTLPMLVERLKLIPGHKLLILDACFGTTGLKISEPTIQIFAGSQDDQYGTESERVGGGVFTSALVEALKQVDDQAGLSMKELAAINRANL
jgi:uncharacterized caspase-like protein